MSVCIVISQSMYFPWIGLLEQIQLADVFVHYDDVQFSKGSFVNRVQIKTPRGVSWLTIPLHGFKFGQSISEVMVNHLTDWRGQHQDILFKSYFDAPFRDEMIDLVKRVHDQPAETLADVARASMIELAKYYGLDRLTRFVDIEILGVLGKGSQRVHDIVVSLSGDCYLTGHGAKNYLDHLLFENSLIAVNYMDYRYLPYAQLHGKFTPFVSALDLVANCGQAGRGVICSKGIYWKEFMKREM